jgi:hypothetical protein
VARVRAFPSNLSLEHFLKEQKLRVLAAKKRAEREAAAIPASARWTSAQQPMSQLPSLARLQ